MRKFFMLLSFVLVAGSALVFTSCRGSSDDDAPETNKFTIDGVDYKMGAVYMANHDGNVAIISFRYGDSPEGDGVAFRICSTTSTALDATTYQWIAPDVSPMPVSSFSTLYPNGVSSPQRFGASANNKSAITVPWEFTKGTFKVEKVASDKHVIEFSCEDVNGKVVSGYYQGTLTL